MSGPPPVDNSIIHELVQRLEVAYRDWKDPLITGLVGQRRRDPFLVLIGTLMSLRTKDTTTEGAVARLWALADTPQGLLALPEETIAQAIYPVGFYKTKAATIHKVCRILLDQHDGQVPDDLDVLLELPGVGRKTANLVLTMGYGKPGICVDTHVHRISNRFGYVETRTPDETEFRLREILPLDYWIRYNDLLVAFGQQLCRPISPMCSTCPVEDLCPRIGVKKHR